MRDEKTKAAIKAVDDKLAPFQRQLCQLRRDVFESQSQTEDDAIGAEIDRVKALMRPLWAERDRLVNHTADETGHTRADREILAKNGVCVADFM